MRKYVVLSLLSGILVCFAWAQSNPATKTLSVWHIYGRQFTTVRSSSPIPVAPPQETIAVFTPTEPIVIRRVEAISLIGPKELRGGIGTQTPAPNVPCPLPFSIVVSDGKVSQPIPISNTFIARGSTQTYTDSGAMNLPFASGSKITVAVVPPQPGISQPDCAVYDLNINVQYVTE